MADQTQIALLYNCWVSKTATHEEVEELFHLLEATDLDAALNPLLEAQWQQEDGVYRYDPALQQQAVQKILRRHPAEPVVHRLFPYRRWLSVAAVLILITGATWLLYQISGIKNLKSDIGHQQISQYPPGRNGAILTLADGRTIVLDSASNGEIAHESGTVINLQNNQLIYNKSAISDQQISKSNLLSTPPGRQFVLVLPDGTKVWLNAASSVRFPAQFTGKERRITVSGEAFLEVAPDASHPFYVRTVQSEVQVLGTSMNINAYPNERTEKTTLVTGRIVVNGKALAPGEQARVADKDIRVVDSVDIGQVLAWKDGLFNFEGLSFEEVMRQLERWYDIEVIYEKGVPTARLGGKMTKGVSLQGLLLGLEQLGVHYRLDGRKLVIRP